VTTGEKLARRAVRFWVVFVLGIVLFFGGLLFQAALGRQGAITAIVGFVILLVPLAFGQLFWFRCPSCRGNLSQLFVARGPFGFGRRARFCPYCGISLDEESPTEESVEAGETW
jgi:hypothetical protein